MLATVRYMKFLGDIFTGIGVLYDRKFFEKYQACVRIHAFLKVLNFSEFYNSGNPAS